MKTVWAWLAKILLIAVVVEGWFIYDLMREKQQLQADNIALESRLLTSEQALAEANSKIETLEKNSLEGMLKETNKAVVSGWEALLNKVQKELEKARDALPGSAHEETESSTNNIESSMDNTKPSTGKNDVTPDVESNESIEPIKGERT